MKNKIFFNVVVPIVVLLLCCTTCSCTTTKPTNFELCHQYYQLTEILLQEIDDDTDWSTTIADEGEVEETKAYYTVRNLITTTDCVTISHYRLYYKVTQNLIKYLDNRYDLGDTTFEGDTYCEWCKILKQIKQ